jgi:subtilisin family serine protease
VSQPRRRRGAPGRRASARKPEHTYFYREGRRLDLEKAPDVIGISFLSRAPAPPRASALTEPGLGSTQLRCLAYLPCPRFAVYRLDLFAPAGARELRSRRDLAMDSLRGSGAALFVSHAYRTDPRADSAVLVLTDQIVAAVPDLDRTRLRSVLSSRGLVLLRTLDAARRIVLIGVTSRAGENGLKAANRLVEDGVATGAEPNFVRRLPLRARTRSKGNGGPAHAGSARPPATRAGRKDRRGESPARPDDPLFANQWHLENRGRAGGLAGADAKVVEAWTRTTGTRKVTIAVVDDGVDLGHEEFRGRGKQASGWNFQDRNDDPSALPDHRHGTACAGLATALANNGRGVCGVAPGCRLLPVRTPDEWGDEVGYADAIAWAADQGADVVSCSWGPPDGYWTEDALPLAMDAALERATTRGRGGRGAVVIWAAGNGNEPVDLDGFARDARVIAVAATDDRDVKAGYSDFGDAISLCAPAGDTLRGRPGLWTTDLSGGAGYSRGSYTGDFSGTSAAAPVVAGVAALVLSVNADLGWRDVRRILEDTADEVDPDGTFTDARGETRRTAYVEGRSACYGHGRVNAAAAVERARELRTRARR